MEDTSKTELRGSDYLDIVNEINDFIASLDAPPLDNHTHKLVGNASSRSSSSSVSVCSSRKKTFGNHGDDDEDDDEPPESCEGLRRRNRSGDSTSSAGSGGSGGDVKLKSCDEGDTDGNDVVGFEGLDESSLSFEQDLEELVGKFPVVEIDDSKDPFATYDYVDSAGAGCGGRSISSADNAVVTVATEYGDLSSDCSNTSSGGSYSIYSDGSSSSCDAADSDSGCYSYSQCYNTNNGTVNNRLMTSTTGTGQEESISLSGKPSPGSPTDSASQQHPRHQSADSSSCSTLDHNYLDLGSSAHSISSCSSKTPVSSFSTTAATQSDPEQGNPNDPQSNHQQQQRHHHQQQQQHSFLPKDHQHYPYHFQNYHKNNHQLYHHQQGQGQYSAPTSPAVKRKLFNQGVIAEIKIGRSFDDSTHHLTSSSSHPPPPSSSLPSNYDGFSPYSVPSGTKAPNHQLPQQQNQAVYSQNQQQQQRLLNQPLYSIPVNREHQDHHASPLLTNKQHQQQHQQPHFPLLNQSGQPTRPNHNKLPSSFTPPTQPDRPRTCETTTTTATSPITEPPPKAPDLSVLISELLSVAPSSCHPSPTSPTSYTDFARSESVSSHSSPSSPVVSKTNTTASQTTILSPNSSIVGCSEVSNQTKHFKGFSSTVSSSHYQTPQSSSSISSPLSSSSSSVKKFHQSHKEAAAQLDSHHDQSGRDDLTLGHFPPSSDLTNEELRCSFSSEHDYEPIENIQLDIPTSPRPDTKFPHPRGLKKMAEVVGGAQPKHVKALHNFKGSNNDELCFKKGDIVTVTQCLEGGWWEGTLNGRTGWFPSNYAKEVRADISLKSNKSGDVPVYKRESMQLYHNVVLKNVIETEKTHVSDMIKVLQSYIKPIEEANLLSGPEYKLLVGNLEEVIAFQQTFLSALEECEKLPSSQRRIGGVFMQFAPDMKEMYSLYCANHPRSVSVLQNKREELSKFVEGVGASTPGAQALTTILSKPFTRLDKYPSLLKELERHVEESHPDRGDTQRAIAVYKNIANTCSEIRKMKEMEHEIITSTIQGWEGEEISKLGEILHLSQVKLHTQTGEKFERIFLLFQSCLVMLSMSSRLSSYQYEGNVPLSGLSSATLVESGDCFEVSGPMIEKITVSCGSKTEASTWMELLNNLVSNSGQPASSAKPQPLQVHMISTCQPSVSTVTSAKTAQISSTTASPPTSMPPSNTAPAPPSSQNPLAAKTSCVWSLTCLRPSPPLRPSLMCRDEVLKSPRAGRKSTQKRKPDDPKVYNEDAFILQVIEAYCNSVKTRHTVNSCRIEVPPDTKKKVIEAIGSGKGSGTKAILNSPQILLAEEEKIFDETEQQERTVVDTVYALQDRVKDLEQEQRKLRTDLDEERRKLEMLVRGQVIKSGIIDMGGGGSETNGT